MNRRIPAQRHGPDETQALDDVTRGRLAAIVDSSDDAIVSKTLDGVITSWNAAAERMFGYTSAEAVGQFITLIIPIERRAEETEVLARIRRGEMVDHFETLRQTKDGRLIPISLTVSPIKDAAGRVVGASKIVRDISDRQRIEDERAARLAEAEAANRAKDEFLAMLGHELRNPLAAVASAAHALGRVSSVDDVARPLAVIARQISHLRRLVDDLLDLARLRSGKITLVPQQLNLADAVHAAMDAFRDSMLGHTVHVDTEAVGILADPTRLEQVIHNLLSNAVKYTPTGKAIRVSVRAEPGHAVLTVIDEGIGMSADFLPRVFDLFTQSRSTRHRAQGGLGLGLSLVRSLVELHGGTVEAASDGPGHGSRLTVRLPRVQLPVASPPAPERRAARCRILVVEDNDDARQMLRLVLELEGHEVFEAADGATGLEMAARTAPDVALIDLGLPGLDGYEVARRFNAHPQRPRWLIALTGYGQAEDRRRSLEAGFDEHIVKPIDPRRLAELLEGLLHAPSLPSAR